MTEVLASCWQPIHMENLLENHHVLTKTIYELEVLKVLRLETLSLNITNGSMEETR
jgi:hypothetical protein